MDSEITRERFNKAVEAAAANAAQQVAQIHRRRLVLQSFIAAMVAAATIVVIGMLIVSSNNETFSRNNAIYDCQILRQTASLMGAFVNSDAQLRGEQNRHGLGQELSHDFLKIIAQPTLAKAVKLQHDQTAAAVALWRREAQKLNALGATTCVAHLSG